MFGMDIRSQAGIVLLAVFLISAGFMVSQPEDSSSVESVNASFGNSTDAWAVLEVADNRTERKNGLMNVTELGEREGMLFIFPDEGPRAFWMKNTLIPLDMIFLDAEKQVLNVETAQPQPNTSDENLDSYRSEGPAKYVIEVNAGFADNYSVEKGDRVKWK